MKPAQTYQTKPVFVEAFQITAARMVNANSWPDWLRELAISINCTIVGGEGTGSLYLHMDGAHRSHTHEVPVNHWILFSSNGTIALCEPETFKQTYQVVPEDSA